MFKMHKTITEGRSDSDRKVAVNFFKNLKIIFNNQ